MSFVNEEFDYLEEGKMSEGPLVSKPELKQESVGEKAPVVEEKTENTEKTNLFVVKVTAGKEARAFEMISERVTSKSLDVYAIAKPHGLKGYLFLEAKDKENAEESSFNLPYVKGILPQRLSYVELRPMLEPITAEVNIEKDDVVEMIAEPFKKEKAKVIRVDKSKGEVVVSLLGAIIPIPVTVKIDNVRVIRREEEDNS